MSAGVLFDAPGPRARRRRRVYAVAATVAILALAVLVTLRLCAKGRFAVEIWEPLQSAELQRLLVDGLLTTLRAFTLAATGSLALGALLAVGLRAARPVRWAATAAVAVARALPPLVLVFALYAGGLTALWALVLGLALHNGCAQAEVLRAGIDAVPRGQTEAGYAVGMRGFRVMTTVLVPQVLRAALPAVVSQLAVILKDTALGYVLACQNLRCVEQLAAANIAPPGGRPYLALLLGTGALYVAMCLAMSALARRIERVGARGRG